MACFLSAVTFQGVQLPVRQLVRTLGDRERPRFVVVDGAQALNHIPLGLGEEYCDLLLAGCHKWLRAYQTLGLAFCCRPSAERVVAEACAGDAESAASWTIRSWRSPTSSKPTAPIPTRKRSTWRPCSPPPLRSGGCWVRRVRNARNYWSRWPTQTGWRMPHPKPAGTRHARLRPCSPESCCSNQTTKTREPPRRTRFGNDSWPPASH